MDTPTQPILCCIGESVAGRPTQFVMERAFSSAGLDWRALTVEVEPGDVAAALAGIQAMKFQAVRFFPSCQQQALAVFVPNDPVTSFVGGITSAARVDGRWRGWHNVGQGIVWELTRRIDWANVICWLHGDSVRTRSLLAANLENRCKTMFWTQGPTEIPNELTEQMTVHDPEHELLFNRIPQDEIADAILASAGDDNALAIVADVPLGKREDSALTERCELLSNHFQRCLIAVAEDSQAAYAEKLPQATLLSEIEQTVSSEAYDFHRWTDVPADLNLLRDAYDEYCDF